MRRTTTAGWLIAFGLMMGAGRDACIAQNPDPGAAAKYGFGFRNFVDSSYSWDIYCHSFFGVPLDPDLEIGRAHV